jgi:hypothetical protein
MTVVGRKWKAGVAYTRFGCTAHYSRGNAICANALTLSENKAQRAIVAAIRAILANPKRSRISRPPSVGKSGRALLLGRAPRRTSLAACATPKSGSRT